jgi:two-component system, NarL family, invasion response regulator UvrY
MIRIVLVDDHELVRTGFRHILSREADLEVIGEGATGEEGIALARKLAPEVMLMDLHLPGISGLEAIERIVRGDSRTRVIAVTAQDEQPFPRRALEAGAAGYLTKACPAEELVRAVRTVARGGRYLSADVARELALANLPGTGQSPFEALSKRELEVAMQLARGGDLQGIARLLSLSPKTVATYKYRLFEKLGVDNEVALAQLAQRFGVLGT